MNIVDYFHKLKRTLSRRNIESDIDTTRGEIENHVLPALTSLIKTFHDTPRFKSNTYGLYNEAIKAQLGGGSNVDMFNHIHAAADNIDDILTFCSTYLGNKEVEIAPSGMTISDVNVLQLLDNISLFVRYTGRLTDCIVIAETNFTNEASEGELAGIRASDINYLSRYRESYIATLKLLTTKKSKFKEAIENIPEIVVSDIKSKSILNVHGVDKTDPFGFGRNFVVSYLNPVWVGSIIVSDYQNARYRAAKEEAAVILMRINRLKALHDKKPDPKLEEIIRRREGQVDLLRAKISTFERKLEDE